MALVLLVLGGAPAWTQDVPAAAAAPAARWTIFIWMAADNDLEPQAMEDLKEIELGLPETGVEVIVFVDRHARNNKRFGDWSGGRLYRMRPHRDRATLGSELLRDFGPVNSNDTALLAREMAAAFGRFPAQRHAAVFWNHGGGWSSMAVDEQNPDSPGKKTDLSIMQIGGAVRAALGQAGLARLDLIGFDMCLMAQMETAAELRGLGRILVASQATEPGTGWSYDAVLPLLARPDVTAEQLAERIIDSFDARNREAGEQVSTLSAVDLDRFETALKRLDEALDALKPQLPSQWTSVGLSLFHAEGYAPAGRIPDLQSGAQALASIDIVDAFRRLRVDAPDGPAVAQLKAFDDAMRDAILASRNSPRHRASNGLAVYAPIRGSSLAKTYAQTRFARESRWLAFLEALHAQGKKDAKPPEVARAEIVNAVNGIAQTRGGLGANSVLRVLLRGESILFATATILRREVRTGRLLLDSSGFLVDTELAAERLASARDAAELMLPRYTPGGAQLSMDAPGIGLLVAVGDRIAHTTLDTTDFAAGVPQPRANALVNLPELGPVTSVIDFDPVTLEATGITALVPGADGKVNPRRIRPRPDLQLLFLVTAIRADSRVEAVPGGDVMLWGDGPRLIFDLAPPGPYQFQIAAESVAGPGATRAIEFEIGEPDVGLIAFVHAARARAAHDFAGTWSTPEGTPFGRLSPIAGRADLLAFEPADPKLRDSLAAGKLRTEVRIDLRRLPMLSLITRDERDRAVAADHGVLYVDPNNRDSIRIRTLLGRKGDARGQTLALLRQPGTGPTPGAPIAAAAPAIAQAPLPPLPGGALATTQPGIAAPGFIDPTLPVGTWRGRLAGGQDVTVVFHQTGSYQQQVSYGPQFALDIVGQWSVSGRTLLMRPQSWQPSSWCTAPGQCQPIALTERALAVDLRDENSLLVTSDFIVQRQR